jgi:hypothetical protein
MEVITLQSEVFYEIMKKMSDIQQQLEAKQKEPKDIWIDNDDLAKILKVTKRTIQNYRDNGIISFSQIGSKIYYRLSDVEDMLLKHYNKAFKQTRFKTI